MKKHRKTEATTPYIGLSHNKNTKTEPSRAKSGRLALNTLEIGKKTRSVVSVSNTTAMEINTRVAGIII